MEYPAKILLFGEYGIILNSMALAMPYSRFSGKFAFIGETQNNNSDTATKSNESLKRLLSYLHSAHLQNVNLIRFENELNDGLFFDSTIPVGSGLGSSGAVTAAVYDRYVTNTHSNEYQLIKKELAEIETCFHGFSSGFDPLISLLKQPVLIENPQSVITDVDLTRFFNTYTIYLINTHSQGNTNKLVSHFIEQYRLPDFKEIIDRQYIPLVNRTIETIISPDFKSLENSLSAYSEFQLTHFEKMIPQEMKIYFRHGIESGDFHLKLCGSGGGGYILGIAHDNKKADAYFNLNHLDYTVV